MVTHLYQGPPLMTGRLDPDLVRPVALNQGLLSEPMNWLRVIAVSMQRPYALLFLPVTMRLLPVIPIVKLLSRRIAVYLANDYEMTIRQGSDTKWPGWSTLFRLGHEYPIRLADVVIARGRHLARLARRFNENVIETVPIGHMNLASDSALRTSDEADGARHVMFLGKVLWSKGLGDLLLAFQSVVQSHPKTLIVLDVVGDGADRRAIEAWARELGLDGYARFYGWIEDREELSSFFGSADLLVIPTSSYPEGVPRVIDEALMIGVPVVATRVGGIPEEFTDDEVMLVDPNSPEQLARAIEMMLFDIQVRQRYLAGAQRRSALWAQYGSAAQQHARILLGGMSDVLLRPGGTL